MHESITRDNVSVVFESTISSSASSIGDSNFFGSRGRTYRADFVGFDSVKSVRVPGVSWEDDVPFEDVLQQYESLGRKAEEVLGKVVPVVVGVAVSVDTNTVLDHSVEHNDDSKDAHIVSTEANAFRVFQVIF